MPIAKTLQVGQVGYVELRQLWLSNPVSSLYVEPSFYVPESSDGSPGNLLPVKRTEKGYYLAVPKEGKIRVTNRFPHGLGRFLTLTQIAGLVVPGQTFRPAIHFYFA